MSVSAATARSRTGPRILPRGWGDFALQLGLFALVDLAYEATRALSTGSVATAFQHARDVVSAEQTLGIFNELALQHWTLNHPDLLRLANLTYFHAHFGVTTLFLFWLYLRRNDHYYFIRNMVFAAMGVALLGYMLYPTAPPRMLTDLGFTDTLEKFASVNHDSSAVVSLSNPFAAMPSVHTCFALIIGGSCFLLIRHPLLRSAWLLYPALIVFSIVATANHFWLDAVLGAGLALVAFAIARALERRRPTLPAGARRALRLEPAT